MENQEKVREGLKSRIRSRTFICSVVLVMAFTYFGLFWLLFAAGLIFRTSLNEIFTLYLPGEKDPSSGIVLFLVTGFILYLMAITGLIILLLKRRIGYYIFTLSIVLLLVIDLAFFDFDWLRYLIMTGFIFILGVFHFSGGCYPKK